MMNVKIAEPIILAVRERRPVVALETAVLTHGLPKPLNLTAALAMEEAVAETGAVPCTIGVYRGNVVIGLSNTELTKMSDMEAAVKLGLRDLPAALAMKQSGGTTVAATAYIAYRYGMKVFATGGIGGVHRGAAHTFDISGDLKTLSNTPLTVVSSGAKAILDLPLTLEYLETMGIPVAGYKTETFPAFYAAASPYTLNTQIHSAGEAADIARVRDELGLSSAVLICNPPPGDVQIPYDDLTQMIDTVQSEIERNGIIGKDITPHMLGRLAHLSGGQTLKANKELLVNNAKLAGEIACALAELK